MKSCPSKRKASHHATRTKNAATYHTAYISYLLEKGRKRLEYLDMLTHEFGYIQEVATFDAGVLLSMVVGLQAI